MTGGSNPERSNVMDRLREADPLPTTQLDATQLADADTLLRRILAEPPPESRPATGPGPRRPRVVAAAAATLCLALAVLLAGDLVQDDDGPTVADRAYAAVTGNQVIYHFVLDTTATVAALPRALRKDFDLVNGRLEEWYRSDGKASLSRQSRRDRHGRLQLFYESARSGGRVIDYDAERDVLGRSRRDDLRDRSRPVGPLARFQEAYRDGQVLEGGTATFRGRPAYRLLIRRGRRGSFGQRMTYYVDRKTYLPLGTRERTRLKIDGRPTSVSSESVYTVYERLEDTRSNRALLRMSPHPGARRVQGPAFLAP